MKLPSHATLTLVARGAILVAAVALWIVGILLLLEVTRQLLDTIRFIVELGRMS